MPSIQFKGKSFVQNHHLAVPYHELVPNAKKSVTDKVSLHDNLVVHGDNLLSLKALLPTYAGKVKLAYIDPPYNTGNETWVYSDSVNGPVMKEWIGSVVGREGEDLTRHDKWLCMMTPRLKLLRELLHESGSIFVCIDDNEMHGLRLLMDEIFGQANLLSTIVWEKGDSPRMDVEHFSSRHDYVIAYAKDISKVTFNRESYDNGSLPAHYNREEEDGRRYYTKPLRAMGGQGEKREARPNLYYALTAPDGTEVFPKLQNGDDGAWRWSKEKVDAEPERIDWVEGKNGWTPYFRIYADTSSGVPPETIFFNKEVGSSRTARAELKEVFPKGVSFDTPKPVGLAKKIIGIATDANDIVLDSFAGSGTTAQAVLELNQEDGGNRQFVLAEMEDYADKITAERVRRVIKGVPEAKSEGLKAGYPGSFSYFDLGDAIETDTLLSGKKMPTYKNLARYIFFTATGEEFNDSKLNEKKHFVGSSSEYDVYMYYKPDAEYLKSTALTLDEARALRKSAGDRPLLVFAPTKYVEQTELDNLKITFCQLPFEIYKVKANGIT